VSLVSLLSRQSHKGRFTGYCLLLHGALVRMRASAARFRRSSGQADGAALPTTQELDRHPPAARSTRTAWAVHTLLILPVQMQVHA
jgi:hypothetical protein